MQGKENAVKANMSDKKWSNTSNTMKFAFALLIASWNRLNRQPFSHTNVIVPNQNLNKPNNHISRFDLNRRGREIREILLLSNYK